jgi:AraC-like DNA-binding protein
MDGKRIISEPEKTGKTPRFFSADVSAARRFYLDLTPPAGTPLAVVCGGCEHCTPDYHIQRATFPYYSIEYVALGGGTVTLRDRTHALQPGRLFSYGPGIRQDIRAAPDEPLVKYFVDFTGRRARALLQSCALPPGSVSQAFPPDGLQTLFDELIHCGLRDTRQTPDLCVKLLECLVLRIAESRAPLERAKTVAFNTYQQCRRHIRQHFQRLKTLEQISRECRVNDSYLCRLFKRYDHQSPYQYLLHLKMSFAAELLSRPGALVKQVADQVGFSDPFHFSKAFKSVLGASPDTFRHLR